MLWVVHKSCYGRWQLLQLMLWALRLLVHTERLHKGNVCSCCWRAPRMYACTKSAAFCSTSGFVVCGVVLISTYDQEESAATPQSRQQFTGQLQERSYML
jgi:hypothetical protein